MLGTTLEDLRTLLTHNHVSLDDPGVAQAVLELNTVVLDLNDEEIDLLRGLHAATVKWLDSDPSVAPNSRDARALFMGYEVRLLAVQARALRARR